MPIGEEPLPIELDLAKPHLPPYFFQTLSVLLVLWSLLALFKAPIRWLWIPAIVATEGGHYLALGCLALSFALFRMGVQDRWAAFVALVAALLFLTPIVRALPV